MKWLAAILLVGVGLRHAGASWLAPMFGVSVPGTFYVLGGMWEALLCLTVMVLLSTQRRSPWRGLALGAMAVGFIEGALMAACRLASGISLGSKPRDMNLCDWVIGVPIGPALLTTYVVILCYGAYRK